MMHFRDIAVWILLVTIVAGGTAGPALHQFQHASDRLAADADKPCHSEAVHNTDKPVWGKGQADLHVPDCLVCTVRLLVVSPAPTVVTEPTVAGTQRVEVLSTVTWVQTVTDRFIRGPPSRFGDRLA